MRNIYFNYIRQTYVHRSRPLVGLAICEQGQSLASSGSQSGTVFVLRIDSNSSKLSVIGSRQLDLEVIIHNTLSFYRLLLTIDVDTVRIITYRKKDVWLICSI